jgi:hypothetical protein
MPVLSILRINGSRTALFAPNVAAGNITGSKANYDTNVNIAIIAGR